MTLVVDTAPTVSADERAARLTDAGTAWSNRISANVDSAKLSYTVTGVGEGAVASRITAGKQVFFVDEPAALAGDDIAASPVEVALGALISCQIVVYRLYAHNLGIRVDSISAEAEGDLDVRGLFAIDETVRPGFSAVRLTVRVTGPESDDRYAELHAAVDAHCPVLDLFANPTPVTVTLLAN
ncbi:OsmC family protein [Leifsonia kafniensis]|uniref:OsmC family protein n=1 Tax=Leifsonia kafniensis TaxID=475957 RepID=A0ABP7KUK7_9MICO